MGDTARALDSVGVLWLSAVFSLVTGGMLASACGVAGAALIPLGEPQTSRFVWGAMHSLAGLALVWVGGYALLKRIWRAASAPCSSRSR